ncbi:hypothetical protein [Bartonella tamiae]|uniref:Nudix hydrolase domain-containing protein n=1 Tax=Bartonella tamiae Th239 TaxID=1094558 RepID=J1JVZ6_9HYPH|nr:hypothetical protein [Bartonella tamiae]EJF88750.1 hypothetical protein ME5_01301 [Bartonella tamiae Th239]EJF95000.1 hypothetical protein MEG_00581 [Bartonella tamiae Th307]
MTDYTYQTSRSQKPKKAASLLNICWRQSKPYVLIGKRHHDHRFLPGFYVFNEEDVKRRDYCAPITEELIEADQWSILNNHPKTQSQRLAKAFGVCTLRETFEKNGAITSKKLKISKVEAHDKGFQSKLYSYGFINLSYLRYFARAITLFNHPCHYDTYFYMVNYKYVTNPYDIKDKKELSDLQWLDISKTSNLPIHPIKKISLAKNLLPNKKQCKIPCQHILYL